MILKNTIRLREEESDNWAFCDHLIDKFDLELSIKRLSPQHQEIIQLKIQGYTLREIAHQTKSTLGYVRGNLKEIKTLLTPSPR